MTAGVAIGVVSAVVGASNVAFAAGLDTYPDESAEAEASFIEAVLGGNEIAGLGTSEAGSATNAGPNTSPFSGEIAGTDLFDLGNGVTIPLDQLLAFGELGALQSRSTATDALNAEGISGIAGANGGISLDSADGDFGNATIDLLSILEAAGVDTITDQMIDQAQIDFGLGGAWVQAIEGEFQDPDEIGGLGQYRLADLLLQVHSPAVELAAEGLSDAVGQIEDQVVGIVNDALGLADLLSAVPGVDVNLSMSSDLQQDVLDAVLLAPITTDDGLASIDLGSGQVTFDLGRFGGNDDGVRGDDLPIGINNQNPNTELIDSDTYPFIASSIHDVIEKVIDVAYDAALEALQSATFTVEVSAGITPLESTSAGLTTNLAGDISDRFCDGLLCAGINPVLDLVSGLMTTAVAPILNADPNPIYQVFETVKTDLITVPVRAAIDPFLEIIASNLLSLQLNHQETQVCTLPEGGEVTSALEVSALSLGVLDGAARLNLGNAGARIGTCDAIAGGTLDATSPAPAGGETEVTGSGWGPDTEVSLQLTDPDGAPVGDPVPVTTDADGNIPDGTTVPIPADVDAGDYTVVGTDPDDNTAVADLAVYAPTLEVTTPVNPGVCSAVVSGGWLPETEVTIQLTDADGAPVGDPVVVTTDADGNVPADTCVTVPEGTEPGDYTVVASDDNGAEVTVPLEVVEAGTPLIDATSPAPAGGETEITGSGWAPDTEVSLQLTDPDGAPVGDPVPVTTDADGNIPEGTVVPIPADVDAGDYTVVGTDPDDNTAETDVTVYAPTLEASTPVAPGEESDVTSGGWLPGTEVSLQLTDENGEPVGDSIVVTTDADGNVPAGTTVPVPADAEPGDYTILGTDDNGAEVTAPLEVGDASAPSVDVAPNVPAGTCAEIVSSGWAPNSSVTFTLVGESGDELGSVTFETDADGNVVGDPVCIDIPEDAEPGDYTVVGEDEEGNGGEGSTSVYAPSLEATSPVAAGDETEITSGGWLPESETSLQLTDENGEPVGDPVVVTTDEDGNVPDGTTVPVPDGTEAGDYTVAGTDDNGANVSAAVEVFAPTLEVETPVLPGDCAEITSGGWPAGSEVSFQLTDAEGNPVGEPVVVTTDENGDVPEGTCVQVPEDAEPGDYTVGGGNDDGGWVEAPLVVDDGDGNGDLSPVLEATSPVPAGGETGITSSGWAPNSDVTIALTDPDGEPSGETVTVTTDEDGDVPVGTVLEVPADAIPADGYAVTAEDADGNTADAIIEVVAAGTPVIQVSSPAPAGGEITVLASSGWTPETDVRIVLSDPNGNPLGDAVIVSSDEDGNVPAGTTIPVPAAAEAGDGYTVTATGADDKSATDDVSVYAPTLDVETPVVPGASVELLSSGWLPNSEITFELENAAGDVVGEPVVVTSDDDGSVPAGTALTVPADAELGSYTVSGFDDNGATVSATLEVADDTDGNQQPTISATSPVPAGGETTITSAGWTPGSDVMIQLWDGSGESLGSPLIVTADADGDVPEGTVLAVPAEAEAGTYGVSAVDESGAEAKTSVDVYAPVLDASSPAPAGGETTITSTGWQPLSDVWLVLRDADGAQLGDAITVTTDADGDVPVGTALAIPADIAVGSDLTVRAKDAAGAVVEDSIETVAAGTLTLDASSPVVAGGDTTVTSSGWSAGASVSLTLTDESGEAQGDPVVVTADDNGSIPAGTMITVPTDAALGTYTVTGTDADGTSVSDEIDVYSPTITAETPVRAGAETAITSGGWYSGSTVTLKLTDADGTQVGDAVTVTVDQDGNVPAGTALAVPNTGAAEYMAVATDEYGVSVDTKVVATAGSGDNGGNGNNGGDDGNGGGLNPTGGDMGGLLLPLALLALLTGAAFLARSRKATRTSGE